MKISPKFAALAALPFTAICLGVAITAFVHAGDIEDPAAHADSVGYAWFWMFLAGVSVLSGALSWWLLKTQPPQEG